MCKNVMKLLMAVLLIVAAVPFVNAQVKVGDILCEGDTIVSPSDYDTLGYTAVGVVFYVDGSGEHGWAVSLDNVGISQWGKHGEDTSLDNVVGNLRASSDTAGFANTKAILADSLDYPAFKIVDFENGWYLPAVGQLKRLFYNLDEVNETLEKTGGKLINFDGYTYWSSTERSPYDAWYMCSIGIIGCTSNSIDDCKTTPRYIRSVRTF